MKGTKLLPIVVITASLLLSACSGLGSIVAAPAAALANQAISLNGSLGTVPIAVNPQTATDAAGLQNAYEFIYQNVNPSVVTIEISSQVSASTSGQSRGFGGQASPSTPTTPPPRATPTARARLCPPPKVPALSGIPPATS